MQAPQVANELKSDVFGRVELIEAGAQRYVRRVACGSRLLGSAWAARLLLRRERRALAALAGMAGIPQVVEDAVLLALTDRSGRVPPARAVLVRSFHEGLPLHRANELPLDFFDHLEQLVQAVHARGVCHNDLHKEQNIVVASDGSPALIDFQLASVHARRSGRIFSMRVRDDLRHLAKHRRRYTRDGRGPAAARVEVAAGYGLQRSPAARVWRRTIKPLYELLTRRVLGRRDGEERRPSSGPWPAWGEPLGKPRSWDPR